MNCIGCGDLVDREGRSDKVCSSCRSALARCKDQGFRPAYVVSEFFRYVLSPDDTIAKVIYRRETQTRAQYDRAWQASGGQ